MTAPRTVRNMSRPMRQSREWRIRWAFFIAGIAFAAVWVAL